MSTSTAPHRPSVLERMVLGTLPYVPNSLMRRFAARYIAGEELPEALDKLEQLARVGHPGILDILGEHVSSEGEARRVVVDYRSAAERIRERGLDCYISVKPTHFGLALSPALALDLYDELASHCASLDLFLRVEMEDHPTTDATLEIFEELRKRHKNVGVVLQARLRRTPEDIARLAPGPLDVRMVKGIYLEPESIAFTDADDIRRAFMECTKQLFDRGARVSLATHDDVLAKELNGNLRERGLGPDRYEYQVLLGVREPLWAQWRQAGHPVRVYVPYGPNWRAYSLRRLGKNPELLRAIVKNTLSFGSRG